MEQSLGRNRKRICKARPSTAPHLRAVSAPEVATHGPSGASSSSGSRPPEPCVPLETADANPLELPEDYQMSDLAELSQSTSSRPSGDTVSRLPKGRAAAKMLVRAGYRCSQCFARHTECLCRPKQVPYALQKVSPLSVRNGRSPLPVQAGRAAPAHARSWPWLALSHRQSLPLGFADPAACNTHCCFMLASQS